VAIFGIDEDTSLMHLNESLFHKYKVMLIYA